MGQITSRDHFLAQIEKDEVLFVINTESKEIAGTIQLKINIDPEMRFKSGYLTTLAVNPDITKQGLGKILVAAAEKKAKDNGCTKMDIEIFHPADEKSELYETRYKLAKWYMKQGYIKGKTNPFVSTETKDTSLLKIECALTSYDK